MTDPSVRLPGSLDEQDTPREAQSGGFASEARGYRAGVLAALDARLEEISEREVCYLSCEPGCGNCSPAEFWGAITGDQLAETRRVLESVISLYAVVEAAKRLQAAMRETVFTDEQVEAWGSEFLALTDTLADAEAPTPYPGGAADSKEVPARPAGYTETDSAAIRAAVSHIARGCRAATSHNPAVYEQAIEAALASLVARLAAEEARADRAESMAASNLSLMEAYRTEAMGSEARAELADALRRILAVDTDEPWGKYRMKRSHLAVLKDVAAIAREALAAAEVSARYHGADATPETDSGGLASEPRGTALAAIDGVLDLLQDGSRPFDEQRPFTVTCRSNGYGLWLVPSVREPMSTRALTAEELLGMVEARAEMESGTHGAGTATPESDSRGGAVAAPGQDEA